jgi:predicted RNase H-like HicB family nuclease
MKRTFTATVWQEGDWYIAQALELDVASQGLSEEEALANLREAIELSLESLMPVPKPRIRRIEIEIGAA